MTNMRFHAIALSCIIVVVVLIFSFSGKLSPEPEPPQQVVGEEQIIPYVAGNKRITIWEASWGLGCNNMPSGMRRFNGNQPSPEPKKVPKNNVLSKVKELCDGKEICEFLATEEILGTVPEAPRCRPDLTIVYRCFEFDRPWNANTGYNGTLRINCKKK